MLLEKCKSWKKDTRKVSIKGFQLLLKKSNYCSKIPKEISKYSFFYIAKKFFITSEGSVSKIGIYSLKTLLYAFLFCCSNFNVNLSISLCIPLNCFSCELNYYEERLINIMTSKITSWKEALSFWLTLRSTSSLCESIFLERETSKKSLSSFLIYLS